MTIECQTEISQFVTDIWSTFLSKKVSTTDKPFEPKGKDNTLAGCVQITGKWQGTVTLYAPREIGKKVAATIYGLKETEVDNQQVQDVIGEITNILAGNIKSLFPAPCSLSLPSVAITDYKLHHPGSQTLTAVNFDCEGLPFLVVLLQEDQN
ncbi:MAG: chemotaxis protein CheX [Nitrospinota bacterium]|nr:chemotaxis protein CheX [Nitrospinota bacterium]